MVHLLPRIFYSSCKFSYPQLLALMFLLSLGTLCSILSEARAEKIRQVNLVMSVSYQARDTSSLERNIFSNVEGQGPFPTFDAPRRSYQIETIFKWRKTLLQSISRDLIIPQLDSAILLIQCRENEDSFSITTCMLKAHLSFLWQSCVTYFCSWELKVT